MRRITARARQTLDALKSRNSRNTGELERGFIVHRSVADPRFLDPTLDPNARRPGWCSMGNPETANNGPIGLARFTTLRSWPSQWSIDDSRGDAIACAARVRAPLLVIENTVDDAVPQPHTRMLFDGAGSPDNTFTQIVRGFRTARIGMARRRRPVMRRHIR